MATLREILTRFSFQADGTSLDKIKGDVAAVKTQLGEATKAVDGFRAQAAGAFGALRTALAGYITLATGNALTFGFAKQADDLSKLSTTLGMTTADVQVYEYALKDASGAGEGAAVSLVKIQKAAAEAAAGTGEAAGTFAKLGIAASELKGMSMGDLMPRLMDAFAKLPDAGTRTAAAMKLFGDQGAKLVPFLTKGAAGAEELRAKLQQAGAIMSASTIETAKRATLAQKDLAMQLTGVKNTIAAELLPEVARITAAIAKWLRESVGLKRLVEIVRGIGTALMVAVGYVVIAKIGMFTAAVWKGVIALRAMGMAALWAQIKILAIPAAILAIGLLIDDLYHFWKGDKDTLVGRLLGEDAQGKLRSFLSTVDTVFSGLVSAGKAVVKTWNTIASIPDKISQGISDLIDWIDSDIDEDGWLGVLHGMLKMIKTTVENLIDAFKKLKAEATNFAGKAVGNAIVSLFKAKEKTVAISSMAVEGFQSLTGTTPKAKTNTGVTGAGAGAVDTGLADAYLGERKQPDGFFSDAVSAILTPRTFSAPDYGVMGGMIDLLRGQKEGTFQAGSQTFSPVTTVNVQVETGADPGEIAGGISDALSGLFKSTYANYKRSGAGG